MARFVKLAISFFSFSKCSKYPYYNHEPSPATQPGLKKWPTDLDVSYRLNQRILHVWLLHLSGLHLFYFLHLYHLFSMHQMILFLQSYPSPTSLTLGFSGFFSCFPVFESHAIEAIFLTEAQCGTVIVNSKRAGCKCRFYVGT